MLFHETQAALAGIWIWPADFHFDTNNPYATHTFKSFELKGKKYPDLWLKKKNKLKTKIWE